MTKEELKIPSNGNKKMASQIDEIYQRIIAIENLITDLTPGVEKVSKERFVSEIREKFERDETLTLIKRIGDNIPTFVTLLDTMKAVKGLFEEMTSVPGKISNEISPLVQDLREKFEKEETLKLIKQVGDNIPTFVTFLEIMTSVKGLCEDLSSVPEKVVQEISPLIRDLREQFERDETLTLIQKIGKNINTFNKLLDFLSALDESGNLNFILECISTQETRCLMQGMQECIVKTIEEFRNKPPKPSLRKLISAINNPEVQKGLLFLTTFAKNLPACLETTCLETIDGH